VKERLGFRKRLLVKSISAVGRVAVVIGEYRASRKELEIPKLPVSIASLRFHLTPKDFITFLPPATQAGDQLYWIVGCPVPIVLREVPGRRDHFTVVGNAYVAGLTGERYGTTFSSR
jgi:hypothetical protein